MRSGPFFAASTSAFLLTLLLTYPAGAQTLKDCQTVYIEPMPESMDRFVSAELVKWGVLKVVIHREKAACFASFARQSDKVEARASADAVGSAKVDVKAEKGSQELPSSFLGMGYSKNAALELIHRESGVVVWADSKTDTWSWAGGPKTLARKLVAQLRKDYQKSQGSKARP